jgi:hypothetical protein
MRVRTNDCPACTALLWTPAYLNTCAHGVVLTLAHFEGPSLTTREGAMRLVDHVKMAARQIPYSTLTFVPRRCVACKRQYKEAPPVGVLVLPNALSLDETAKHIEMTVRDGLTLGAVWALHGPRGLVVAWEHAALVPLRGAVVAHRRKDGYLGRWYPSSKDAPRVGSYAVPVLRLTRAQHDGAKARARRGGVLVLPQGTRARGAYQELRRMGFEGGYAADVVQTLENSRSNMERWTTVRRALREAPDDAREWLKARGYT